MTEAELRELLTEALEDGAFAAALNAVHSFAEEGVLTSNEGIVVRAADGSEFQVTIVRSR